MTDDLLERRLSETMATRGAGARPGAPRFDDVERRAVRLRRRRSTGLAAAGIASAAALIACVLVVVGVRTGGPADITMDPSGEPAVTWPTGLVGDRWATFAGRPVSGWDPAVPTAIGVQPPTGGTQDVEVTPYLITGADGPDHEYLYGLDGSSWSSTVAYAELGAADGSGPAPAVATLVLTGSGFDPTRFWFVPNSTNTFRPMATGVNDPSDGTPNPYQNARPEQLIAAPDSTRTAPAVEHLGAFDWALLPATCEPGSSACRVVAVGGDAERVIVIDATVPNGFDLRPWLAEVGLSTAAELTASSGPAHTLPSNPGGGLVVSWIATPFLTVRLPLAADDAVWPAEVPADYCTAYRQWKQIQIDHLGAFGTAGWIRWAEALDAIAPGEVGDAFRTLADEEAAGHDASATEPGIGALDVVVTDGDTRCPT